MQAEITLRQAAQQALEALDAYSWEQVNAARAALRTALAEPEQEPVAYIHRQGNYWEVSERFLFDDEKARGWTEEPLYTHPVDDTALLRQALEVLESVYPYTDSLICYASTVDEHPPNAIDGNVRDALTALRERLGEKK